MILIKMTFCKGKYTLLLKNNPPCVIYTHVETIDLTSLRF